MQHKQLCDVRHAHLLCSCFGSLLSLLIFLEVGKHSSQACTHDAQLQGSAGPLGTSCGWFYIRRCTQAGSRSLEVSPDRWAVKGHDLFTHCSAP